MSVSGTKSSRDRSAEPPSKRPKRSVLSERIHSTDFRALFSKHWRSAESLQSEELCVYGSPFRLCKISNFLSDESLMEDAKVELAEVKSRRRSMDLYQFEQTGDLAAAQGPNLSRLRETLRGEFARWVEAQTGVELNGKLSVSSSAYYDTDYLLCHDDNMGDRRIAFVLYLSKDWSAEDGGSLDLYDTDENGAPRRIIRSLIPEYNSLIFFEVNDRSYHRVAEVTSPEKSRWTINGWFHGPPPKSARKARPEIERPMHRAAGAGSCDLRSWIRSCYLETLIAKNVQKQVEADSYAFLANFFRDDAYEILSKDIASDEIVWSRVGPPDVRNYEVAEAESLPEKLREFCRLFRDTEMFALLKKYTELDLVPDPKNEGDPRVSVELQRWSSGCYTLICDKGPSREEDEASDGPSGADEIGARVPEPPSRGKYGPGEEASSRDPTPRAACSGFEPKSDTLETTESEDSDVSDIGDYLSDRFERSIENSDEDENARDERDDGVDDVLRDIDDNYEDRASSPSICEPGSLDLIVQFNTARVPTDETIDYVDPNQREGALIHVPFRDNHLCLAYKTASTTRLHKYVNHYCKGYFYNLICTYYE